MNRYQLAKIVEWAGTFRSRKRMQKLVFMLQAAGCPLDAEYELHPYGPYSFDVARIIGELVCQNMLVETSESQSRGELYSYTLSADAVRQIADFELAPRNSGSAQEMAAFHLLSLKLYEADIKELEVAATIVFFRSRGAEWMVAVEKTCRFKNLPADTQFLEKCKALANEIAADSRPMISAEIDGPKEPQRVARRLRADWK
jgi:uncharacterized protein YwgA